MIILDDGDWRDDSTYSPMMPRYIFNESAYSILSRFTKRNAINSSRLVSLFSNGVNLNRLRATKNLSCLFSVDINKMELHLRLDKREVYKLFLVPGFVADVSCVEEYLKYCPFCLSQQRHYAIFQMSFIHDCPLHRVPLIRRCTNCGASISNRLEASTFRLPYGCPHCDMLLVSESSKRRQFCRTNKAGERLLHAFEDALRLKAEHILEFSFQRQTSVYCDNVLCLSKSLKDALESERIFFHWLLRSVREMGTVAHFHYYPKFRLNAHQLALSRSETVDEDASVDKLFAVFKSISRHITRKLKARRCLRRMSKSLWWNLSGSEQPPGCPSILALIAWRAFWLNARTPADTLQAERRSRGKIQEWLQSMIQDSSILIFPTAQKTWLVEHIFVHALTTTLNAFFSALERSGNQQDSSETAQWPSDPLPSSNCWAVYIDNEGVSSIMTFMPGPGRESLPGFNVEVGPHACRCLRY